MVISDGFTPGSPMVLISQPSPIVNTIASSRDNARLRTSGSQLESLQSNPSLSLAAQYSAAQTMHQLKENLLKLESIEKLVS
jgi:hypothetical protein